MESCEEKARALRKQLATAANPATNVASWRKLALLERKHDHLARKLQESVYASASPAPLTPLHQAIPDGWLLLEYVCSEERAALFWAKKATKEKGKGVKVGYRELGCQCSDLELRITTLRSLMRNKEAQDAVESLAQELYKTLMGNLSNQIEAAEGLLIVPDGPLFRLPFAVLVPSENKGPLGTQKPIAFVPSAGSLAGLAQRCLASGCVSHQATVVGVGGWRFSGPEREAWEVSQLLGSSSILLMGSSATLGKVAAASQRSGYLHMALHASASEAEGYSSYLELGDGRVNGAELVESMRLSCALVTLSGCSTGLGEQVEGEGTVGLTRAFLMAGARAVVSSLWNVPDLATRKLMTGFYRQVAEGVGEAESLRLAMASLCGADSLSSCRETPMGWAGFELWGVPSELLASFVRSGNLQRSSTPLNQQGQ